MPLDATDLAKLLNYIGELGKKIDANGAGAGTAQSILQEAAEPIKQQMIANAGSDPRPRSGALRGAIDKAKGKRRRGQSVTVGVHRKDWHDEDYYPVYVEYGHGGPAPAPPHPYIQPAFDVKQDEANDIIIHRLIEAIEKT